MKDFQKTIRVMFSFLLALLLLYACNSSEGGDNTQTTNNSGGNAEQITKSDVEQIKANFDAMINAYNNKDIGTFMSYVSQNFLNSGETYTTYEISLEDELEGPEFKTISSYTIQSIVINTDKSVLSVIFGGESHTDTFYLIKEDSTWNFYGDQKNVETDIFCCRFTNDQYWIEALIDDPDALVLSAKAHNDKYGSTTMHYNISSEHQGEWWSSPNIQVDPVFPQTWTMEIMYKDGSITTIDVVVNEWEWAQ